MTRKKKLFLNTGMALLKQVVTVLCGFILPRYMLLYYGSAVNGLVSSITSFLSFISLLEMGIGPVVQANLYRPLAEKNNQEISKIVISAERFFRRIALFFLAYIIVLAIVFPKFINTEFDAAFSVSLLIIISVSTFAQYYFGATYQLLLNADQRGYIQLALQIITLLMNTVLSICLMKIGTSVQIVKLITAGIYVLRPIGQSIYVRKHYKIDKKIILDEEPIKQKWNGFAQHLSAVLTTHIDTVLLSFFSTMTKVSIYNVYFLVTDGITQIVLTASNGIESYFGNLIARKEIYNLQNMFIRFEWLIHLAVSVLYTITAIMIAPFIKVYTLGIDDAPEYYLPLFGMTLVFAYAMRCLRLPYFTIVSVAGCFKETQKGALMSTAINIIVSVLLVFKYDLVGIAIGTMAAMFYHTCYLVWYLRKKILCRPIKHFMKHLLSDALIGGFSLFFCRNMFLSEATYFAWVKMAVQVSVITIFLGIIIKVSLHFKEIRITMNSHK